MRRTKDKSKIWLRAVIIAGCIPVSGMAQDRFIYQPKQAGVVPPAAAPVQQPVPAGKAIETSNPVAVAPAPVESTPKVNSLVLQAPQAPRTPAAAPSFTPVTAPAQAAHQTLPVVPNSPAMELSLDISEPLEKSRLVEHSPKPFSQDPASTSPAYAQGIAPGRSQVVAGTQQAQMPSTATSATFRPLNSNSTWSNSAQNSAASNPSQSNLQWYSRESREHATSAAAHSPLPMAASTEFPSLANGFPEHTERGPLQRAEHTQSGQSPVGQSQQRFSEMETRVQDLEVKLTEALVEKRNPTTVARLVSSKIVNDPRFKVSDSDRIAIAPIETPTGWQAIGEQLAARMSKCESLLSRGAYYSAREEAETGILILLRQLDLMDNSYRCEPSLAAAKQALREAEDFVAAQRSNSDLELVKRLIDAHETPLLKGVALDDVSPATAAQHYRLFAEKLLVEAAMNHPWASELYYAIGRAYQAEADLNATDAQALRTSALCYYRAARTTLPTNAVACNQLGYLLLQLDRPADAREAIASALSLKGEDAYLSNYAEASRRLGDTTSQQWAIQTIANRHANRPPARDIPQVMELTPVQFAELSPYASSPNVGAKPPAAEAAQPVQLNRTATAPVSSNMR